MKCVQQFIHRNNTKYIQCLSHVEVKTDYIFVFLSLIPDPGATYLMIIVLHNIYTINPKTFLTIVKFNIPINVVMHVPSTKTTVMSSSAWKLILYHDYYSLYLFTFSRLIFAYKMDFICSFFLQWSYIYTNIHSLQLFVPTWKKGQTRYFDINS